MSSSLFRNQTKGLLLRTWHYQRRQYCTLFCNLILPSIFMLIIFAFGRGLKGREVISFPFQRAPKGAFAPRPFDPSHCISDIEFSSEQGLGEALRRCNGDPFVPKYTVPVHVAEPIRDIIGTNRKNAMGLAVKDGLLGDLSLQPFVYPDLFQGDSGFSTTLTPYDGVLLHAVFEGNNTVYRRFLDGIEGGRADEVYNLQTVEQPSTTALRDEIFNQWFKGTAALPRYSSAYSFEDASPLDSQTFSLDATVFYNESSTTNCTKACSLVSNVARLDNAIFKSLTGRESMAYLRRMPAIDVSLDINFIPLIISVMLGLTFHFWFPSYMQFLVFERVARMRAMMSMMGLKKRQYWFGTYLGMYAQYTISTLLLIIVAGGTGIPFFSNNTPLSYLILFFLWGNVIIAFAMALVPFFGSPQTAQIVGWLYVILVTVVGGPYLGTRLGDDNTGEGTWFAIMLLPSFAFLRSVYYAGALNSGGKGVVLDSEIYTGFDLGMCKGTGPFCKSYAFLAVQWFVLMLLASYFDRVLPSAQGSRLHPLFMFGFKRRTRYESDSEDELSHKGQDVIDEENRAAVIAANIGDEPFDGVVLDKLSKSYPGKPPVKALQSLSLVARKNEVLCILAHNGAGKTTAFRTLVGEIESTSGAAYVNGYSILNEMDQVHRQMGVAPQQDILWSVMSAEEHLYFYGRIKNLSGQELKDAVKESLESVQLTFARKRRVSALSGGMKRRLSVSIAMIGYPDFIILDEPSTGLDILAREKLWQAIERNKQNKAIIMTTHSLEEAETLSNRVAIMSQGRLKCIGKAEELKLRLGKGHHLSVSLPSDKVAALHDAIIDIAPDASLETKLGGNLEYVLPKSFAIPEIFRLIERKRDELEIREWAISQSTLEDVFLEVTDRSRNEKADVDNFVP